MDRFEQLLSPQNGCILITLQMFFWGMHFWQGYLVCFQASCSKDQKFQWRKPFGILSWEFDGYPQIPITLSIMVSQKWWFGDPKEPCEKQRQPPRFWRFRWYLGSRYHVYFWWRGVLTPRKKRPDGPWTQHDITWYHLPEMDFGIFPLSSTLSLVKYQEIIHSPWNQQHKPQAPQKMDGWELGDCSGLFSTLLPVSFREGKSFSQNEGKLPWN